MKLYQPSYETPNGVIHLDEWFRSRNAALDAAYEEMLDPGPYMTNVPCKFVMKEKTCNILQWVFA